MNIAEIDYMKDIFGLLSVSSHIMLILGSVFLLFCGLYLSITRKHPKWLAYSMAHIVGILLTYLPPILAVTFVTADVPRFRISTILALVLISHVIAGALFISWMKIVKFRPLPWQRQAILSVSAVSYVAICYFAERIERTLNSSADRHLSATSKTSERLSDRTVKEVASSMVKPNDSTKDVQTYAQDQEQLLEIWEPIHTEGSPTIRINANSVMLYSKPSVHSELVGKIPDAKYHEFAVNGALTIFTEAGVLRVEEDTVTNVRNFGMTKIILENQFLNGGAPTVITLKAREDYPYFYTGLFRFIRLNSGEIVSLDSKIGTVVKERKANFWVWTQSPLDAKSNGWLHVDGGDISRIH